MRLVIVCIDIQFKLNSLHFNLNSRVSGPAGFCIAGNGSIQFCMSCYRHATESMPQHGHMQVQLQLAGEQACRRSMARSSPNIRTVVGPCGLRDKALPVARPAVTVERLWLYALVEKKVRRQLRQPCAAVHVRLPTESADAHDLAVVCGGARFAARRCKHWRHSNPFV